jgi:NADH dehydrogenase
MTRVDLVTGAFGFTGRQIAARLLERGVGVRTLTRMAAPAGSRIQALPYSFDDKARLVRSLEGVHTLYNTYWVRFVHGGATYDVAVRNTRQLFDAAREAGVRRFVHVSIANAEGNSDLPYYRGKELLERDLVASGMSYAILRPTVLFGDRGILINNIAWLLRRFPVFAIVGRGEYRLQPVHVDDLARLAVEAGDSSEELIADVAGPEVFTYEELVRVIRTDVGSRSVLVHVPQVVGLWLGRALGLFVRDVLVTREELRGLRRNLLVSHEEPRGGVSLRDWLEQNRDSVGFQYLSELGLHYRTGDRLAVEG